LSAQDTINQKQPAVSTQQLGCHFDCMKPDNLLGAAFMSLRRTTAGASARAYNIFRLGLRKSPKFLSAHPDGLACQGAVYGFHMKTFLALFLFLLGSQIARALPLYSITDLGDFPGGADQSQASDINAFGQVVGIGQNSSRNRGFLTAENPDGTIGLVDLGALSTLPTVFARSINARGQIVGGSGDGDKSRSFLWNPTTPNSTTGSMIEVEIPTAEHNHNTAMMMNARGQIVGFSVAMGYLWSPTVANGSTGTSIDLGGLPGGFDSTLAFGINDRGQVVGISHTDSGQHAFLWTPMTPNGSTGSMIDLGNLPGASGISQAVALNEAGAVVGHSVTSTGGQHAMLWTPDGFGGGAMRDLGALEGGVDLSSAYGINAANEVVGYSNSAGGDHAFYWTEASGIVDLNSLTDATGQAWILRFAHAINDGGQIVGYGEFDPDGAGGIPVATHAYRADRIGVVSRKTHGVPGDFDIDLSLPGNAGIECRSGGANSDYKVVFTFPTAVTLSGASVTPAPGKSGHMVGQPNLSFDSKKVTVDLTDVANAQTIAVTLSGVSNGTNTNDVTAQMKLLVGDTKATVSSMHRTLAKPSCNPGKRLPAQISAPT
jgi:probable HAF family extracellular repeat protein